MLGGVGLGLGFTPTPTRDPNPHQDLEEDPALRYPSPSPSPNPDPNQDLEEDPTLRSQINLYKDEAALQAQVRPSGDLGEI